jgi:hypothetical protein
MKAAGEHVYKTRSPVLLVIFNRPGVTGAVFEAIRSAATPRLYIAADGPREGHLNDISLCAQTREILNKIDWDCRVETLLRDENLGCRDSVSEAVNWFFSNETEGIILEDDCLPANSFFRFCDEILEKYRNDGRVRHITGCNLQFGKKWGDASYYLSNRVHVWGWASWRRAWKDYDITLAGYDTRTVYKKMLDIYGDALVAETWTAIFNDQKAGKINSWAYSLDFANFLNDGLVVIPNQNLISNIGFGVSATNTLAAENSYANIPLVEMERVTHPSVIIPQKEADLSIINRDFDIPNRRKKQSAWHRRLKRWAGKLMK